MQLFQYTTSITLQVHIAVSSIWKIKLSHNLVVIPNNFLYNLQNLYLI